MNSCKEIIIHIGTHKTGTTSIQNFLATNRKHLLKKDRIYFPETGTLGTNTGHHNLAWQLVNSSRFKKKLGDLDDLLVDLKKNDFKRAILSSEDFEYLISKPEIIKKLDEALCSNGFKTKYLAFFREIDSYAKSLFFELNKRGLESDFSDFLQKIKASRQISYPNNLYFEFDRDRFASRWNQAVGEGKLICIDYDKAKEDQGIIARFLMEANASKETITKARFAKHFNKTSKRKRFFFYISRLFNKLNKRKLI